MNVMLVDDAMFMRSVLKKIIESNGHIVIAEADNGLKALEEYKKTKPDIVFMDITMPKVDGIEGLKLIREFDREAKIIMCSAMGQKPMIIEALKNGAKDFIVKPFAQGRVIQVLINNY